VKNVPNVILIVMDTVRADHLSCYGYHRKTTPNIDRIAELGVLFENAFTTGTWSPPSHASIFTGKYPSYHKTLGRNVYLSKDNATIAEILKAEGYSTMGVTNCTLLRPGTGFERGFQNFLEPFEYFVLPLWFHRKSYTLSTLLERLFLDPKDFVRALTFGPGKFNAYTNKIIKSLIESDQAGKKPFFLFVNYFNCHAPYDPPKPFKERFCDGFTEPPLYVMEFILEKILGKTGQKIANRDLDMAKLLKIAGSSGLARFSYMAKELQISEREWEVVRSWYDGEIAYLDYCIGELISFLCNEGLFDNTVIIITADHGENFGEHGLAGHHFGLYDSVLHVPLIMCCPSLIPRGKRVPEIVSSVDILPTVLSLCNLSVKDDIQGKRLFPFEERGFHDFICAECEESVARWALTRHATITGALKSVNSKLQSLDIVSKLRPIDVGSKCIRNGEFKYIFSADGREELYDVVNDPTEEKNIINEHPDEARYLRGQLEKTIDITYFGPEEISYDEKERIEIVSRLKALGYI